MLRGPGKVGEWGWRAVLGQLFRCECSSIPRQGEPPKGVWQTCVSLGLRRVILVCRDLEPLGDSAHEPGGR